MRVHIKRGGLVVGIFCMGTAFALASSEEKSASADVVDVVVKDRSSSSQQVRNESEPTQAGSPFDLSAIRRTAPSKAKRADLFDPKSWLTSISRHSGELTNPQQAQVKVQMQGKEAQLKALDRSQDAQVKVQDQGQAQDQSQGQPQQQSAAPAMPFTFVGRMIIGNEVSLFLIRNDRQYVAKVNDVLDNAYRVDKITGVSAVLTYLPMNTQQTITFNSTAVGSSFLSDSSANGASSPVPPQIPQQPSESLTTK